MLKMFTTLYVEVEPTSTVKVSNIQLVQSLTVDHEVWSYLYVTVGWFVIICIVTVVFGLSSVNGVNDEKAGSGL